MKKKEREDPRRVGYFVRFEVESVRLEKEREREKKIKRLLPISGSPGKRKKKFSLENSDRPF